MVNGHNNEYFVVGYDDVHAFDRRWQNLRGFAHVREARAAQRWRGGWIVKAHFAADSGDMMWWEIL